MVGVVYKIRAFKWRDVDDDLPFVFGEPDSEIWGRKVSEGVPERSTDDVLVGHLQASMLQPRDDPLPFNRK
jgi:hypothetical protein